MARARLRRLDELWWGGVIESWPSLAARCAAFRASARRPCPTGTRSASVSHWGFIRGLTGAELHNTDSIRLARDEAPTADLREHI